MRAGGSALCRAGARIAVSARAGAGCARTEDRNALEEGLDLLALLEDALAEKPHEVRAVHEQQLDVVRACLRGAGCPVRAEGRTPRSGLRLTQEPTQRGARCAAQHTVTVALRGALSSRPSSPQCAPAESVRTGSLST